MRYDIAPSYSGSDTRAARMPRRAALPPVVTFRCARCGGRLQVPAADLDLAVGSSASAARVCPACAGSAS